MHTLDTQETSSTGESASPTHCWMDMQASVWHVKPAFAACLHLLTRRLGQPLSRALNSGAGCASVQALHSLLAKSSQIIPPSVSACTKQGVTSSTGRLSDCEEANTTCHALSRRISIQGQQVPAAQRSDCCCCCCHYLAQLKVARHVEHDQADAFW